MRFLSGLFFSYFLLFPTVWAQQENAQPFAEWLAELRVEAEEKGISADILDQVFAALEPNPRVIELDRKQPEFTQTYQQYLTARLSPIRIQRGQEKMVEYRDAFARVAAEKKVQPRFIAAIWGIETNYGATPGNMSVVQSLATLAYDPRRAGYFRNELLNALRILTEGHIPVADMKGSWAGAMGQPQFMPSSFNDYAQDFDGDGRRDIWLTEIDVFASIAHYLKRYGWRDDMTWGREVLLPANFAELEEGLKQTEEPKSCQRALRSHTRQLSLAEWQDLGVRRLNGDDLPDADFQASLVRPAGAAGSAYLTYDNFRAILRYNCSNFYALGVGHLADRLR